MKDETLLNKNGSASNRHLRDDIAVAAGTYIEEKKYWLEKLSGTRVKTGFPYDLSYDHPYDLSYDPAQGDAPGEPVKFSITGELFAGIEKLGNRSDARLHMILTAALAVLLYKHTGSSDIILGTPVYKQDIEGEFVNTALALRSEVKGNMTFKEVLFQVRQTVKEAVENQNYPVEALADLLCPGCEDQTFSLFDTALLLENIQDRSYLSHLELGLIFSCRRTEETLEIELEYNPALYSRRGVAEIGRRFLQVMEVVNDVEVPVARVDILPEEEKERLSVFSTGPEVDYPFGKTLPELFRKHVKKRPKHDAVACGLVNVDYRWLETNSNHLTRYLVANGIGAGRRVGVLMDRNMPVVVAILAVWKAGAAYVPIDPDLPEKRMITMIDDAGIGLVLSERKFIKTLNRLQWACKGLHTFFLMNSRDVYAEEEAEKSGLMDPKLWEYIGETATDDIMGGGWVDSYTGEHFKREVVEEFAENLYQKIKPVIQKDTRVLEIGCASGIGMYRIAPLVGLYYGTDISRVIIDKNKKRVEEEGHRNIKLGCMAAHEIDGLDEGDFDIVIINSVIQDFHGHNYLRKVIRKAVDKLGKTGYLFVGDVMDQDSKDALIEDLIAFKRDNRGKGYKTKINWDAEQFFSRDFFRDLAVEMPAVQSVECSDKIFTIENELTKFRFDVLMHVDKKKRKPKKNAKKNKYQHGLPDMEKLGRPKPICRAKPGDPAYVIYTSGSTGAPKGAVVEHIGMMNHIWAKVRDFQITENSVVAQNAPLSFDISVWQLFAALAVGGKTLIYHDEAVMETGRFTQHIVEDGVTVLEVVPSYLSLLLDVLDINPVDFKALEYLLVTGEAVAPGLLERWFEKYPAVKVANAYGPTEASDDITHYIMDRAPRVERVPIGKPIQNLRITIVDDDMNPCPVGVKGEIWVAGVGVGLGYLGDEEKTRKAFMKDPFYRGGSKRFGERDVRLYKTGDLGCWLPDGNIDFFGRKDQQVKIRGFRIELGEIENKLAKLPEVKEVAVIDAGGDSGDQRYLCAYVVPDPAEVSDEFDVNELKEYLQEQLPDYMIPQFFVKMDQLPLTSNGKVDRKNLPAHHVKFSDNYEAPAGETEEKLVDIVADVLGLNKESIGVNDDFFDLGANSISILSLQHRISKEFDCDISISLLFLYPTVRGAAKNIHEEGFLNKLECIVKLNDGRNERNIFMIHPMHGMIYQYKDVAGLLKDHFNIYGIQVRGFLTGNKMPETIDEMASDYLRQIRVVQKEGPYIIAGYCFGCTVGYEIVKRLENAGEEVTSFLVLDEPVFIPPDKIDTLHQSGEEAPPASAVQPDLPPEDPEFSPEVAKEVRRIQSAILNEEKIADELLNQFDDKRATIESHLRKIEQKVSGVISTDIHVIKARENDRPGFELELYEKLTRGSASLEVTDGDHNTMFYPPNVRRLAELIVKRF